MDHFKTMKILIACISANLGTFAMGTCIGWTSPMAPKLRSAADSPLDRKLTLDSYAWLASILPMGSMGAPVIAGLLADSVGRKWTLLSSSKFFIIGSVIMMTCDEEWELLLARLIQGFGTGFIKTILPMYICEISTDTLHGAIGFISQVFALFGILFVYSIGPFVSYKAMQWCCLIAPIAFDGVFYFMPETPYYFAFKGNSVNALNSLHRLHGNSKTNVEEAMASIQKKANAAKSLIANFLDMIKNRGKRKALLILIALFIFPPLSGRNAILYNSQTIFESAETGLNPAIATIIVGIAQLASACLEPFIAKLLGRKIMLFASGFCMSIGLVALGAFFYIKLEVGDPSNINWMPLPALMLFNIGYCIGFGPLPWTLLGEMFPTHLRLTAAVISISIYCVLGFLVTRIYSALDALGSYYAFWFFAIFCAIAFFFAPFIAMETKRLSLQENATTRDVAAI